MHRAVVCKNRSSMTAGTHIRCKLQLVHKRRTAHRIYRRAFFTLHFSFTADRLKRARAHQNTAAHTAHTARSEIKFMNETYVNNFFIFVNEKKKKKNWRCRHRRRRRYCRMPLLSSFVTIL